jgi:cysteine-rich PDZ-binding protein
MVCTKCQKLQSTKLATPEVKKKSEIYFGSPASSSKSNDKKSATLGQNGVGKVSDCFFFDFYWFYR